jgi:hypothetical protein
MRHAGRVTDHVSIQPDVIPALLAAKREGYYKVLRRVGLTEGLRALPPRLEFEFTKEKTQPH